MKTSTKKLGRPVKPVSWPTDREFKLKDILPSLDMAEVTLQIKALKAVKTGILVVVGKAKSGKVGRPEKIYKANRDATKL